MAASITHATVATGSDSADQVSVSQWNATHTISGIDLASGSVTRTAGDLSITSTSFVDVTGMSLTITIGAHRCLVVVNANGFADGHQQALDIDIDGSRQGQSFGLMNSYSGSGTENRNLSFSYITAGLSAGSHTFKLQARTDGGTFTLRAGTAVNALIMSVVELYA